MLVRFCVLIVLWLAAHEAAQAEPCRNKSFKGTVYIVCSFNLANDDLRIFWRSEDGKPYRTFGTLRRKSGMRWERVSIELQPRSVYLLRGPARTDWQHSIPPVDKLRYSITFRTLRFVGRK